MRINKDYILREIAGEAVIIPTGEASKKINGMIALTETAAFIWKQYDKCENLKEVVEAVLNEYEIGEEEAKAEVMGFSMKLAVMGMLEDVQELGKTE